LFCFGPQNPTPARLSREALDMKTPLDSEMNGIFVMGAPAFINENIDPIFGLANGTKAILHSLGFASPVSNATRNQLEAQMAAAAPGGAYSP